jgi:hypothetical protein
LISPPKKAAQKWKNFINKKVAQVALLYTEKELQPQNRKSKKIKYGDYFGRNLFFTPLWHLFLVMIMKPHMNFDIPTKKSSPKMEKFHCYMHRFAVS